MTLSSFLPISFDLQVILQEMYYIQSRSGAWKEGITPGQMHEHDKSFLPHQKPAKAAKILSQLPSNTASTNQPKYLKMFPLEEKQEGQL